MTREQLNQTVYVVIDGEIEPMTYEDYLREYQGEDRLYVKEITADYYKHKTTGEYLEEADYNDKVEYDENFKDDEWEYFGEAVHHYEIWMNSPVQWRNGATNNGQFDSEEEAELYMWEKTEKWILEKNWQAPRPFDTEEEAEKDIIEGMASKWGIDDNVAASIRRKEKIVKKERAISDAAHRAKITAEYNARKAYLSTAVPAEAETFTIDEKFKADLKEAAQLSGNDKSNRHASALKGLIERNGKEKIESDFWQVFRILKAKASN